MITSLSEIVAAASGLHGGRIVVCGAENPDALRAVVRARRLGLGEAVLVGDETAIRRGLDDLVVGDFAILPAASPEETARVAVADVAEHGGVLMKGGGDTRTLLHAVLAADSGLRSGELLSHVALLEVQRYPKLLAITDGGVTVAPTLEQKQAIVRNAVRVTRALGIERAKVAALAAKEKVNPKMPATTDAAALKETSFDGAIVDGPLALDNAVDPHSAELKGIGGEVAGDADVLLVPDIETGNVLVKTLQYLGGGRMAGLVLGARVPIVLTSRADHDQARLDSLALALLVEKQERDRGAL